MKLSGMTHLLYRVRIGREDNSPVWRDKQIGRHVGTLARLLPADTRRGWERRLLAVVRIQLNTAPPEKDRPLSRFEPNHEQRRVLALYGHDAERADAPHLNGAER